MLKLLRRLWKDKKGLTALEYGVLAALLVAAVIAAMAVFSPKLQQLFSSSADSALSAASSGSGGNP